MFCIVPTSGVYRVSVCRAPRGNVQDGLAQIMDKFPEIHCF